LGILDFCTQTKSVIDFEDVKSRGDRKAVFNVVQKLKDLGPALPSPHMKSLKVRRSIRDSGCSREEEGLRSSGRSSERSPGASRLTMR